MPPNDSHWRDSSKIKILIVDRSAVDRDILLRALRDTTDIEVLATAPSGVIGLMKAQELRPDLVLLEVDITDTGPVEITRRLLEEDPNIGIILTTQDEPHPSTVELVIQSLERGAFDFVRKPKQISDEGGLDALKTKILPKIRSFSITRYSRIARRATNNTVERPSPYPGHVNVQTEFSTSKKRQWKAIAIGVSTGGPDALSKIVPLLPVSCDIPVLIVLHMPRLFTASMAEKLNTNSQLPVKLAAEGDLLERGCVYLAEGGRHLKVRKGTQSRYSLHYDDGVPVNGCKPSVDVLFESLAEELPSGSVLAAILTGMGVDGVRGMGRLKEAGAWSIAQDEASSVVWGMPGSAVKAGFIDEIVPVEGIARRIIEIVT